MGEFGMGGGGEEGAGSRFFFRKKEAKNFWTFGWAGTRLGAGVRRSPGIDEVFLVAVSTGRCNGVCENDL